MAISSPMEPHLLISAIISVGSGLYFDFIYCCRSGTNPSTIIQMNKAPNPMIVDYLSDSLASGLKNSNIKIPIDMMTATMILDLSSLSFFSLTLEQQTPTKTIGRMLQDSNITTTGKLVYMIAITDSTEVNANTHPQRALFFLGMVTWWSRNQRL